MEKIKIVLRWALGFFSVIAALAYISTSVPIFIAWLLLAALLIPPVEKFAISHIPMKVPTIAKVIAGIVLFVVIVIIFPKSQIAEQVQKVESKPQEQVSVAPTSSPTSIPQSDLYTVSSVIDGDTIQVVINNKKETIRLIGIDTPETVDPRKTVQCFGKEASAKTKSLLSDKSVRLESDPTQGERDKYQRLLKYVFLPIEGGQLLFVNDYLVREGYAHEYTYNIPYKYQSEFKQAQKEAEENKKGLWADDACLTYPPQPSTQTSGTVSPTTTDVYTCNCNKTCPQISSCEEAQYQLNVCGCKARDADKDGIACDGAPLKCQ